MNPLSPERPLFVIFADLPTTFLSQESLGPEPVEYLQVLAKKVGKDVDLLIVSLSASHLAAVANQRLEMLRDQESLREHLVGTVYLYGGDQVNSNPTAGKVIDLWLKTHKKMNIRSFAIIGSFDPHEEVETRFSDNVILLEAEEAFSYFKHARRICNILFHSRFYPEQLMDDFTAAWYTVAKYGKRA